jgi:hypothetical protein
MVECGRTKEHWGGRSFKLRNIIMQALQKNVKDSV